MWEFNKHKVQVSLCLQKKYDFPQTPLYCSQLQFPASHNITTLYTTVNMKNKIENEQITTHISKNLVTLHPALIQL